MTINELKNSIGYEFEYCGNHYKVVDVYRRGRGPYVAELADIVTGYVNWLPRDVFEIVGAAKNGYIKPWYIKTYPGDDLGEQINPELTFSDLIIGLYFRERVYNIIGVYDSVIRERIFEKAADIFGVSYDKIYDLMMGDPENIQKLSDYGLIGVFCGKEGEYYGLMNTRWRRSKPV